MQDLNLFGFLELSRYGMQWYLSSDTENHDPLYLYDVCSVCECLTRGSNGPAGIPRER